MKRGDVWRVNLGARAGIRPAVILTRQDAIPYRDKLTIAEITTRPAGYKTEVDIDQRANLPKHSFVRLDSLQTIHKNRFLKYIGTLGESDMKMISRKIIFALKLLDSPVAKK